MKLKKIDIKDTAIKLAGTFIGIAAGSATQKYLSESNTVSGLTGNGTVKNYLVPSVVAVAGTLCSACSNNDFVKSFGFGVTAVGGAQIVNQVAGKELIALAKGSNNSLAAIGNSDLGRVNRIPRRIPNRALQPKTNGVGDLMPGMGTVSMQPGCGIVGTTTILPGCGGLL